MGLVARDVYDTRAGRHQRNRLLERRDLCVAIEAHRVVLAHVLLHAARGVEEEQVDPAEHVLDGAHHRVDRVAIREIGPHHERAGAELLVELGRELLRARRLAAVVDHDIRAGCREETCRVGADTARGAGHERGLAFEGSGGNRGRHVVLLWSCGTGRSSL